MSFMDFYKKFSGFLMFTFLYCISPCINAMQKNENILLKNEVKKILVDSRAKYNLPAISLSIMFPNNNIQDYVSGYYSLSDQKPITPETLFQIGSITKTFTATIIFKLMEENKLNSNDQLSKWLPKYPRWKNIAIHDLLYHTSGIYNYTSSKDFDSSLRRNPQKDWSLNELADMAYQHPDLFRPGIKYHYTNTDYILLGMIIEKAANRSLQEVFNDYLKQYHLDHTFYSASNYSSLLNNRLAHGYNRDGTFKFNTDVTFVNLSFTQSAGAMISTPHNLVKWLNELFSGKIITNQSLTDMTKIISTHSAKPINIEKLYFHKNLAISKPFTELGIGAGVGLVYFKHNGFTWVHAGGTPGYESFYAYSPCSGVYLALAYSVKPKQQLIFIQIADEVLRRVNKSTEVIKAVKTYQQDHILPEYCNVVTIKRH